MDIFNKFNLYAAGFAIFAMFFGAGNIIFPLALGVYSLDQSPYALAAFLITAVAMPFFGLFTMFFYQGNVRLFFGRLGKIPGFCAAFFIIALLGPFGSAPRCLALAYSTLSLSIPDLSLIFFTLICCVFIFIFVYKKTQLLTLIGYFLSPIKITFLLSIILLGWIQAPEISNVSIDLSKSHHFFHGLKEGYNTMDLLASFFFAPVILGSLTQKTITNHREHQRFLWRAGWIGAFMLALVYLGFCYISYRYASELSGVAPDQLLGVIAIQILGSKAGLIVSLTVAIACLSTAIALIAAFTQFVYKEVFLEKIGYFPIILVSLGLTFGVTSLQFQGIAKVLTPILEILYPVLIGLTIFNYVMKEKMQEKPGKP